MARLTTPEQAEAARTASPAEDEPVALPSAAAALTKAKQDEHINEERAVARAVGLKLGCTLVKWIPWPQCPEEQWVPIRTCSMPELDSAFLFAHGECKRVGREGDQHLFQRWEQYAILASSIRQGLAYQRGLNPDGSIKLEIVKAETDLDNPMFSSPNDFRQACRDKAMLDELLGYYFDHSTSAAPLSTYKRMLLNNEFEALVLMLKKKHGPIDLGGFSQSHLGDFIGFLVNSSRLGDEETDTPD